MTASRGPTGREIDEWVAAAIPGAPPPAGLILRGMYMARARGNEDLMQLFGEIWRATFSEEVRQELKDYPHKYLVALKECQQYYTGATRQ